MDLSDRNLLDRFISSRDEKAFGILVTRYLDQIHAVARRVTGDEELARDAVQATFIRLAERAALISHHLPLAAWLHHVVRCQAVDLVRVETRRRKRELQATLVFPPMETSAQEPDWSALAPVVDELVDQLPASDRSLLLLRYYRNESHATIAARLGLTEGVTRKRAYRAVEKLRALLGKRGITTSTAALASILPAHATPVAPAFLVSAVLQATQGVAPVGIPFLTALFITVNTSQKIALAGSLLLLLGATAYTLAPSSFAGTTALSLAASAVPTGKTVGRITDPNGRGVRSVPATSDGRHARLKQILDIPFTGERDAAFIAYLEGLPPELFREMAGDFAILAEGKGARLVGLMLGAWVKVDPLAAGEFVKLQPEEGIWGRAGDTLVSNWALADPRAAMRWAAANPPPEEAGADNTRLLFALATVARSTPEDVPAMLDQIPDEKKRKAAIQLLTDVPMPGEDLDHPGLVKKMLEVLTGWQRNVFIGSLANHMANPAEGAALLRENPEAVPFNNPFRLYQSWSSRDFDAARADVATMPEGKLRDKAITGLISGSAGTQPPAVTIDLMDRYPDEVQDFILDKFIGTLGKTDPALALEQIQRYGAEPQRNSYTARRLGEWMQTDPDAARGWLEQNPQPSSVLDLLPPQR